MKIFLLGHKGFIGSLLLLKLRLKGYMVFTDQIYFDQKFDLIINLAAKTHIRNEFDPEMITSNIILAERVFARSERIIYASSCSAAHFTNPYAWTKMWNEYLGKRHTNALGLRFFNVYGPGNNKGIVRHLMDLPAGSKLKVRGPELVRDYIYVEDVVDEIIRNIPERITRLYHAASGVKMPVKNIGLKEVGTAVGMQTMDLVNLYQHLSGKRFDISAEEAGSNEPKSMVAKSPVLKCLSLEEGLLKTIAAGSVKNN